MDDLFGPGDTLAAIDCSGFIFRAYFSSVNDQPEYRYNSRGEPIAALKKFASSLYGWRKYGANGTYPNFMAAVFDASRRSFRHDILPSYKSNRPETPDELRQQMPLMRDAARALSIAVVEEDGWESDDLMATLAHTAAEQGGMALIISSDKDMGQCVRPGILVWDPPAGVEGHPGYRPARLFDHDAVVEKFGVPPELVPHVQALSGDPGDGIPGVKGIGPKIAAELVREYGSLEGVLASAHLIKQPKRREAILAEAEMARISFKLASLNTCADYADPIESMRLEEMDYDRAISFADDHGLTRLSERLRHDAEKS